MKTIRSNHAPHRVPAVQAADSSAPAIRQTNRPLRYFLSLAFVALLMVEATDLAAQTHYVSPSGSAAPERDQATRPWQLIDAAVRALPPQGGTVSIAPGIYREAFTIDTPAVLTASSDPVVIDDRAGVSATTTFSVLTWNTHLFGDIVLLPSWQDYERADDIGTYLAGRRDQIDREIDLVSLCEVWDEDLFVGGGGAFGIRPRSGYPNWMIFNDIKPGVTWCGPVSEPRVLHSGLALMTKHPMADLQRVFYDQCSGACPAGFGSPDCLASKGFLATTVVKDGFAIRVYATHTQADDDKDAVQVREAQIRQLNDSIAVYRVTHPSHAVFVMGDMNVIGETAEQYDYVWARFQEFGGRDAARNTAAVTMYNNHRVADTLTSYNELALYFDPTPFNQRLDYVWYFPSLDGHVQVQPTFVDSPRVRSSVLRTAYGSGTKVGNELTSDELSDHYPLEARFRLIRLQ